MQKIMQQLGECLLSEESKILKSWLERCEADEELDLVSRLTRSDFENNMPAALEGLAQVLMRIEDEDSAFIKENVAKHGHHRWKQGFNLQQLVRDWGNLNRVLIQFIDRFFAHRYSESTKARQRALRLLADYLTEAISESVRRFDDLRRAEAAALSQDLEATKEQFEQVTLTRGKLLREFAHDLRGSLAAISGASTLLRRDPAAVGSVEELLDLLEEGVGTVNDMLSSLLDLSRIESGVDRVELIKVDLGPVLEELGREMSAVASEKGLEFSACGPKNMSVETDPQKVRRIAQNLVINAIKYTPQGEIGVHWQENPDSWILKISDTGPGMQGIIGTPLAKELDDEDSAVPELIRSGTQAYQGEGIGLTIVKRLCSMLEAGISMQSELGKGTVFEVDFPKTYNSNH